MFNYELNPSDLWFQPSFAKLQRHQPRPIAEVAPLPRDVFGADET